MNIENLSVKEFRNRLFAKQSSILYEKSQYNFQDDLPDQVEKLPGFLDWESFSYKWDILWVGLDPRSLKWVPGRHHSPSREIVKPLRIVRLDERNKRMMVGPQDRRDIDRISCPFDKPIEESEEDRMISESLSGRVVIDEPDEEKAIRLIQENMVKLQQTLDTLLNK